MTLNSVLLASMHKGQRVERISLEGTIAISTSPPHIHIHNITEAFCNSRVYLYFDDESNVNDPGE